jgi:hypothetical protein
MASFLRSITEYFKDAGLNEEDVAVRDRLKLNCELVKVASIITVMVSAFFFGIFPNMFTFICTCLTAFLASEVHKVADNMYNKFDKDFMAIKTTINETIDLSEKEKRKAIAPILEECIKSTYLIAPFARAAILAPPP